MSSYNLKIATMRDLRTYMSHNIWNRVSIEIDSRDLTNYKPTLGFERSMPSHIDNSTKYENHPLVVVMEPFFP